MKGQTGYDKERLSKLTPHELNCVGDRILANHGLYPNGQPFNGTVGWEKLEEVATNILRSSGFTETGESVTEAEVRRLRLKSRE